MSLLRLVAKVEYEVDDDELEVKYGTTDPQEAAAVDARGFQEDPGFIAEMIANNPDAAEVTVEVVMIPRDEA